MADRFWRDSRHDEAADEPHPALAALAARARRAETPCGPPGDGDASGGTLAWRLWRPEGETAARTPLLLLHGGSGSWRHWARNLDALAAGRPVLAPDLPGLGDSAMPDDPARPDSSAEALRRGLDRVLPALGATGYHLAGFSYGALCAGRLAALDPERCRSLTVIGAGALGLPRSPTTLVKVRAEQGEARRDAHRHNLAALMLADPDSIDDLALAIQERSTALARMRSRQHAESTALRDAIAAARAPLGAIYGERDAIARPHVEQRLALLRELRPGADARMIPGAGHWVAFEAAEAFNAALLSILRGVEARPVA